MVERFEFRPATAEEMPNFRRLGFYVFANARREGDSAEEDDALRPEWTLAAFHRGRVVASSGGFPFKMRLNGRGVPADGVTAVGTDPGFRRRGLVRRLIGDLLRRAHENGQPASILWASMGAIYQRFGYGPGATLVEYSFDPQLASFQFGEPSTGFTRMLEKDEAVPIASKLYRAFIEERNLLLHRAPILWDLPFRVRNGRKTYCAVHYDSDSEPDGYLFYAAKQRDDPGSDAVRDQEMSLSDFVWRDMNAYRGLWDFVRGHDLVSKVTTEMSPEDDPAPSLLLEPRILGRRTSDGIWLRIVDAAAMLAGRGYQHAGETSLEIVADAECPWNIGVYRFATDAVQAEAERIRARAEIRIQPHGLASLLAGHSSLSQLTRIGRAEVVDDRRLPMLDALFSTRYRPHCMNGF